MEERWLPVVGWRDLYEVSDHGRVRSLDRLAPYKGGPSLMKIRGRVLKPNKSNLVGLCEEGTVVEMSVPRLVLTAFVRPPEDGEVAIRLNGVPRDSRLENLKWGKAQDVVPVNSKHGKILKKDAHPSSKIDSLVAQSIRAATGTYKEVAAKYGVSPQSVNAIKNGHVWGGYKSLADYETPISVTRNAGSGQVRGERVKWAKLTDDDVRAIRSRYPNVKALAEKLGVHYLTICSVIQGKGWEHIPFVATP